MSIFNSKFLISLVYSTIAGILYTVWYSINYGLVVGGLVFCGIYFSYSKRK